jgi:hypothetical protein
MEKKAKASKSTRITSITRKGTRPQVHINNAQLPQTEEVKYLRLHFDIRLTWHKHIFIKRKPLGIAFTIMYFYSDPNQNSLQQTPHLQNYTQTNLGTQNTTLGNGVYVL